jgi:hypothetical protein
MIHTGQADGPALIGYAIVQEQMTGVHLDADAVAEKSHDAVTGCL